MIHAQVSRYQITRCKPISAIWMYMMLIILQIACSKLQWHNAIVQAHCYIVTASNLALMSIYIAESIIATDCRTFRAHRPTLHSWWRPTWPKPPATSCYWLILLRTVVYTHQVQFATNTLSLHHGLVGSVHSERKGFASVKVTWSSYIRTVHTCHKLQVKYISYA